MADISTAPNQAPAAACPSASPRPSPMRNPNIPPPYHTQGPPHYGYGGPPPHTGSPNPNAPPPYQMYPMYPPMNGPPPSNYAHQNQGPNSPAEGFTGPPPTHYNMYPPMPPYHANGMPPPNWNGPHPGGSDGGYGWGMPPPQNGDESNERVNPSQELREGNVKDGEVGKDEKQEAKGDSLEHENKATDHSMPPPSYYHPYPPYGNPPPYQNPDHPEDISPTAPHYPPNYPGHQYGPPPHYGPPHAQAYQYPSEMNPYAYPPMPIAYPPYYGQESPSPWKTDKKRLRPSPTSNNPYAPYPPPNKRYYPGPNAQWAPKRVSSQFPTNKSVRRKKKMYSDYVGVTYNKTHAKYQACITHYRKQHYLGRYKLAVDAALAYDESARLLKGASWKVNFATRQAYEEAKRRELESHGTNGGRAIDLEKSMATVVSKIEEIASKSGNTTAQNLVVRPRSRMSIDPTLPMAGPKFVVTNDGKGKHTPYAYMPPMAGDTPSMSKVTPSPSGQGLTPHELQKDTPEEEDDTSPLPETPNPTRHVMGADPTTPDSVIKPTILSYLKGGQRVEIVQGSQEAVEAGQADTFSRRAYSASKLPPTTPKVATYKRDVLTSPRPVIQNGTLAAASALMTLFGNESSPQG